jgi:hypothetical protein
MGLFSTIVNSCDSLGQEFVGSLQTKDFEGAFDFFWIDPNGFLFRINLPPVDHSDMVDAPIRGRVKPFLFTGLIRVTAGPTLFTSRPVWFISGRLIAQGWRPPLDWLVA